MTLKNKSLSKYAHCVLKDPSDQYAKWYFVTNAMYDKISMVAINSNERHINIRPSQIFKGLNPAFIVARCKPGTTFLLHGAELGGDQA